MAVTALLLLLSGCARPQGIQATPTLLPSSTPAAQHDPLIIANPVFHSGEVGVAFAPVTLSATGGVAPYTWSLSVGALPAGLTLSSDGVVSGTPAANGYFAFSVQVLDFGGNDTAGVPAPDPDRAPPHRKPGSRLRVGMHSRAGLRDRLRVVWPAERWS